MAAEDPRHRPLVDSLELIVELLVDPQADLLRDRLDIEARRHAREQTHDHPEVLQVRANRARNPRILDLDGDRAPVVERRPIDLADRGRRDRLGLELDEDLIERLPETGPDDPLPLPYGKPRSRA